jgi:hypothetical protein
VRIAAYKVALYILFHDHSGSYIIVLEANSRCVLSLAVNYRTMKSLFIFVVSIASAVGVVYSEHTSLKDAPDPSDMGPMGMEKSTLENATVVVGSGKFPLMQIETQGVTFEADLGTKGATPGSTLTKIRYGPYSV